MFTNSDAFLYRQNSNLKNLLFLIKWSKTSQYKMSLFSIALVIKTVSDNEINIIQPNLLPELDINLMGWTIHKMESWLLTWFTNLIFGIYKTITFIKYHVTWYEIILTQVRYLVREMNERGQLNVKRHATIFINY